MADLISPKRGSITVDFLLPYVVTYDVIHLQFSGTLYLVGNAQSLGEWDPEKGKLKDNRNISSFIKIKISIFWKIKIYLLDFIFIDFFIF